MDTGEDDGMQPSTSKEENAVPKKRKRRVRAKDLEVEMTKVIPNDEIERLRQTEKILEEKAKNLNLSCFNVKAIIRHITKDPHILPAMMGKSSSFPSAIATRSSTKVLAEKLQSVVTIKGTTIQDILDQEDQDDEYQPGASDTDSETESSSSTSASDSDEYCPEENEGDGSSEEELDDILSTKEEKSKADMSKMNSGPSSSKSLQEPRMETDLALVSPVPTTFSSLDVNLNDMALVDELAESNRDLRFADEFGFGCNGQEDEDSDAGSEAYHRFLSGLNAVCGEVDNNLSVFMEEEDMDPDYNPQEDLDTVEQEEKSDLRAQFLKVSRKEQQDLFRDLLEDPNLISSDHVVEALRREGEEAAFLRKLEEQARLKILSPLKPKRRRKRIARTAIIPPIVPNESCSLLIDGPITFRQCEIDQLKVQLEQHVQLLVQGLAMCHYCPDIHTVEKDQSCRDAYQSMINDLDQKYYKHKEKHGSQTFFDISNLAAAIATCHEVFSIKRVPKEFLKWNGSTEYSLLGSFAPRPEACFAMIRSEAILYPELIPETQSYIYVVTADGIRKRDDRLGFSKTDDLLLALGLFQYGHIEHSTCSNAYGRYTLVSLNLLPNRTPRQINTRVKNAFAKQDSNKLICDAIEGHDVPVPESISKLVRMYKPLCSGTWPENLLPKWFNSFSEMFCYSKIGGQFILEKSLSQSRDTESVALSAILELANSVSELNTPCPIGDLPPSAPSAEPPPVAPEIKANPETGSNSELLVVNEDVPHDQPKFVLIGSSEAGFQLIDLRNTSIMVINGGSDLEMGVIATKNSTSDMPEIQETSKKEVAGEKETRICAEQKKKALPNNSNSAELSRTNVLSQLLSESSKEPCEEPAHLEEDEANEPLTTVNVEERVPKQLVHSLPTDNSDSPNNSLESRVAIHQHLQSDKTQPLLVEIEEGTLMSAEVVPINDIEEEKNKSAISVDGLNDQATPNIGTNMSPSTPKRKGKIPGNALTLPSVDIICTHVVTDDLSFSVSPSVTSLPTEKLQGTFEHQSHAKERSKKDDPVSENIMKSTRTGRSVAQNSNLNSDKTTKSSAKDVNKGSPRRVTRSSQRKLDEDDGDNSKLSETAEIRVPSKSRRSSRVKKSQKAAPKPTKSGRKSNAALSTSTQSGNSKLVQQTESREEMENAVMSITEGDDSFHGASNLNTVEAEGKLVEDMTDVVVPRTSNGQDENSQWRPSTPGMHSPSDSNFSIPTIHMLSHSSRDCYSSNFIPKTPCCLSPGSSLLDTPSMMARMLFSKTAKNATNPSMPTDFSHFSEEEASRNSASCSSRQDEEASRDLILDPLPSEEGKTDAQFEMVCDIKAAPKRTRKRTKDEMLKAGRSGMVDPDHRSRQERALAKKVLSDIRQRLQLRNDVYVPVQKILTSGESQTQIFAKLEELLLNEFPDILFLMTLLVDDIELPEHLLNHPTRRAYRSACDMIMAIDAYVTQSRMKPTSRQIFRTLARTAREQRSDFNKSFQALFSGETPLWSFLKPNVPMFYIEETNDETAEFIDLVASQSNGGTDDDYNDEDIIYEHQTISAPPPGEGAKMFVKCGRLRVLQGNSYVKVNIREHGQNLTCEEVDPHPPHSQSFIPIDSADVHEEPISEVVQTAPIPQSPAALSAQEALKEPKKTGVKEAQETVQQVPFEPSWPPEYDSVLLAAIVSENPDEALASAMDTIPYKEVFVKKRIDVLIRRFEAFKAKVPPKPP